MGIIDAVSAMTKRRLDIAIPAQDHKGDVGTLAVTLEALREQLARMHASVTEAQARCETEQRRHELISTSIGRSEVNALDIVVTLSTAANELEASAMELSRTAQQTTQEAATKIGSVVDIINAIASQTSRATNEISETIGHIRDVTGHTALFNFVSSSLKGRTGAVKRLPGSGNETQIAAIADRRGA